MQTRVISFVGERLSDFGMTDRIGDRHIKLLIEEESHIFETVFYIEETWLTINPSKR